MQFLLDGGSSMQEEHTPGLHPNLLLSGAQPPHAEEYLQAVGWEGLLASVCFIPKFPATWPTPVPRSHRAQEGGQGGKWGAVGLTPTPASWRWGRVVAGRDRGGSPVAPTQLTGPASRPSAPGCLRWVFVTRRGWGAPPAEPPPYRALSPRCLPPGLPGWPASPPTRLPLRLHSGSTLAGWSLRAPRGPGWGRGDLRSRAGSRADPQPLAPRGAVGEGGGRGPQRPSEGAERP